jgi:hypothetical protein
MVSKKEQGVYEEVLLRDRLMFRAALLPLTQTDAWLATDPWVCIAPVIDRRLLGQCFGVMTRDHVHEHTGGTKGKRAMTTMRTVAIVCERHHLRSEWATSHRPEIRQYIKEANERYKAFQLGRPL